MQELLGKQVGSFRVLELIGEGGMAQVYRAEHVSMSRAAAIKVLLPELCTNAEIVGRFVNEAHALGRLRHPGTVDVFDVITLADGRICMVMELLNGSTLHTWRHRRGAPGPAPTLVAEVVPLMIQLAETMGAAHAEHIVHRDLKPENIFLVNDVLGLRTKILDFGIAKLLDGSGQVITATQSRFGTWAYMPPEQFRSARRVDHRSDIYALGCVYFYMLAGRPPYMADNFGQQMDAHVRGEVPSVRAFVPGAPVALDTLMQRMMAKSRDDRPQSMAEVRGVLECIDQGEVAREGVRNPAGQPVRGAVHGRGADSASSASPVTPAGNEFDSADTAAAQRRGLAIALVLIVLVIAAGVAVVILTSG